VSYTFNHRRRTNTVQALGLTCYSVSDVFRSVQVPSPPVQNQNVNVNV